MDAFSVKWLNGYAPMYAQPDPTGRKVRDLLEKSLVMARDNVVHWQGHPFVEVEYTDSKGWRGWVYAGYLEDYTEQLPKDVVEFDDPTPNPNDAEQYIHYHGARQVNLCGEICAAFVTGVTLTVMLGRFEREKPTIWKRIFGKTGTVAGGTGVGDILSMLEAAGRKGYPLTEAMRDPYLKRARYTVEWLKRLVEGGQVIAGVTINKAGRLTAGGLLHWVVVTKVIPERCGYGSVVIYNPFPNRVEMYSWSEFIAAARTPSGVYAPEETQ